MTPTVLTVLTSTLAGDSKRLPLTQVIIGCVSLYSRANRCAAHTREPSMRRRHLTIAHRAQKRGASPLARHIQTLAKPFFFGPLELNRGKQCRSLDLIVPKLPYRAIRPTL